MLEASGAGANLTTDAHIAALALEHGFVVATNDADFARFDGVRTTNPLPPRLTRS
jgi:predicted nucleic acid-binding protein